MDFLLPHCRWTRESLDRSWGRRYGLTITTPESQARARSATYESTNPEPGETIKRLHHLAPSIHAGQGITVSIALNLKKWPRILCLLSHALEPSKLRPFCHCSPAMGQSRQTHAFLKIQGSHCIRQSLGHQHQALASFGASALNRTSTGRL